MHLKQEIIQTNSTILKSDGQPLFLDVWEGHKGSNKVLLIVHGLGEHSGRYKHFPDYLGNEFERFYAMDQRGHGRSGGLRGYAPSFEALLNDLKSVVSEIESREKGKQLFLLGHSFGGLVVLSYLLRERKVPFSGAILSAPLLGIALKIPPFKKFMGEILGYTLDRIQLKNEVNPAFLSHDLRIVEQYVNDRLVHQKLTPRLFLDMSKEMEMVMQSTGPLACPLLLLVPGQDKIVASAKSIEFFRNLKSRAKELHEYPEMYHEIFNEVEKKKVFEDVKKWLNKI